MSAELPGRDQPRDAADVPAGTATDELLRHAEDFAARFDLGDLPIPPSLRVAVVTCMDSRIDLFELLGLHPGEAHVLRNAGGVISPDVVRSLVISQRKLGTREIMLIHHTNCGMQMISDDVFKQELQEETGIRPEWAVHSFTDVHADVRQSLRRIAVDPFVLHHDRVRGFVYDVRTGRLVEVR